MVTRFHRGQFIQRGRGLGSFFRSLWNLGKPILSTLAGNSTIRDLGKTVATTAVERGLTAAADALEGKRTLKEGLTEGVDVAKREIAEVLKSRAKKKQTGGGHGGYASDSGGDTDGPLLKAGRQRKKRKRVKQSGGGKGGRKKKKYAGLFSDDRGDEYGESGDSET
jgi:hypothetical protein